MWSRGSQGGWQRRARSGGRWSVALFGVLALAFSLPVYAADQDRSSDDTAVGSAILEIPIEDANVRVSIDGHEVGVSPLPPQSVTPGRHVLTLSKQGFEPVVRVLDLPVGTSSLSLSLQPSECLLSVGTSSSQAQELLVDGRFVGPLPWSGRVTPGAHELTTRSARTTTTPQKVTCMSGTALVVSLETRLRLGALELMVEPDVHVFVDLHDMGLGPRRLSLPSGHHQLTLERVGFHTWRGQLSLEPGVTLRFAPRDFVPDSSRAERAASDEDPRRFRGIFARLSLGALFGTTRGSDALSRSCPADASRGQCEATGPYGGALLFSAGYGVGWVGAELFGGFLGQVSNLNAEYRDATGPADTPFYGLARRENHTFARYGFVVGAGVRGTTPTNGLRGSVGLGFGFARQATRYARAVSAVTAIPDRSGGTRRVPDGAIDDEMLGTTTSPALVADLGLLIGASPGTKLELSLMLLVQWPHSPTVPAQERLLGYGTLYSRSAGSYPRAATGSPEFESARGTEWFLGPRLGFQFGY